MRQRTHRVLVVLLSLNGAALVLFVFLLLRNTELMPSAVAQTLDPAAKPAPSYVVTPAQLSANTWGCYVLDTSTQTLCVYAYNPGEKLLRLQAARSIVHDTQLKNFNTLPQPSEVAELVQTERRLQSGPPATAPSVPAETGKK